MTKTNNVNLIDVIANRNNEYSALEVEDAVTALYLSLKEKSLSYINVKYCKNDLDLAQDAFQDSFIRLISQIKQGNFTDQSKANSWIKTVACRYVLDYIDYKKQDSRNDGYGYETITFSKLSSDAEFYEYIENYTDNRSITNPVKYHYNKEIMRLIDDALINAGLNDTQRKTFEMYYFDYMKEKEIAYNLSLNLNTVKTNLFNAKNKIKKYFVENGIEYKNYLYEIKNGKTRYKTPHRNM